MSRRSTSRRCVDNFGGFMPSQRGAALKLWLRSDLGITLNGSTVSAWADQSGYGNNVTQGTGAQQPTLVTSDARFGGAQSIDFTTSGTNLTSANNVIVTVPLTIYIIVYALNPVSSQINYSDGIGSRIIFDRSSTGLWDLSADIGFGAAGASGLAAMCARLDGSTDSLYFNNSQTALAFGAGVGRNWQGIHLGSGGTGSAGTHALAEVIAIQGAESAAQRAQVYAYFKLRYGGAFA